jgi:hypothetical protein
MMFGTAEGVNHSTADGTPPSADQLVKEVRLARSRGNSFVNRCKIYLRTIEHLCHEAMLIWTAGMESSFRKACPTPAEQITTPQIVK